MQEGIHVQRSEWRLNKREKEKKKKAKGQKSTLCSAQGFILTLHTQKKRKHFWKKHTFELPKAHKGRRAVSLSSNLACIQLPLFFFSRSHRAGLAASLLLGLDVLLGGEVVLLGGGGLLEVGTGGLVNVGQESSRSRHCGCFGEGVEKKKKKDQEKNKRIWARDHTTNVMQKSEIFKWFYAVMWLHMSNDEHRIELDLNWIWRGLKKKDIQFEHTHTQKKRVRNDLRVGFFCWRESEGKVCWEGLEEGEERNKKNKKGDKGPIYTRVALFVVTMLTKREKIFRVFWFGLVFQWSTLIGLREIPESSFWPKT